ncbi:hypothetical protein [Neisseria animalis]|uniref:hypothetical protein n=1 Tax=Neisseria animalis TaxID=492 RepID=UPI000F4EEBE5|nr:hypothetical protein [Neisseria animalis]
MNKTRKFLVLVLITALFPVTSMAASKTAMCKISSDGVVAYKGKCQFQSERGGSFSVRSLKEGKPLFGEITDVSVYIVKPGVAEVSGLTTFGNNSRWGTAVRSQKQRACWNGSDFQVCAW